METKYYKAHQTSNKESRYLALSEKLEIVFWEDGSSIEYNNTPMMTDYREELYSEITREEFMKAYLPVNEKINNKIAEL